MFAQFHKENGEIDLTLTGENINLNGIMPFLSQQLIDDMFLSQADKVINVAALPFVNEKALHKLVEKYVETPDCDINIDAQHPFCPRRIYPYYSIHT